MNENIASPNLTFSLTVFNEYLGKYGTVMTGIGCLLAALDKHLEPSYYCYEEALYHPENETEYECGIELSCYAGDVNMLHLLDFRDFIEKHKGFSVRDVAKEISESLGNFDVNEEIRCHMEDERFRNAFSYKDAAECFEAWETKLKEAVAAVNETVKQLEQMGIDLDARVSMGLKDLLADNEGIEDGSLLLAKPDTESGTEQSSEEAFFEGPWSNDACKGYLIIAMRECGYTNEAIKHVSEAMTKVAFDQYTVQEAEDFYRKNEIY